MVGMSPCVFDDAACPINPQTGEHVVDLLRRAVVRVLSNANCQDPGARHNPLTRHLAGNPLNVWALCPIHIFHIRTSANRLAHMGWGWVLGNPAVRGLYCDGSNLSLIWAL